MMKIAKTAIAFIIAVLVTYVSAAIFYTQQVIAKQSAIGMEFTAGQKLDYYTSNLSGLWQYGATITIALLIAFAIAAGVKRILTPLAPIAYPVAGAAAMALLIVLIESQLGGGAGVIGGARDAMGISLQCFAGFLGGGLFAMLRPR